MNSITQDVKFKQSVVKYSLKNDVTAASLANKSRRPHRSPRAHTEKEIKMIKDYKYKNKETGLVVLWVKLRRAGYTRSITSLYRMMVKIGIYTKAPSKKKVYEPKTYQQMKYPGERVQVDVKYVPSKCLTEELKEKGERYYQYTAIDEYTRLRVIWFAKEHSTYESSRFIEVMIKKFPFEIEEVQTDNGFEFTNRLNSNKSKRNKKTMFEKKLEEKGIRHKCIKPYTPRHNGKVERRHRKDQERFYDNKIFFSFEDLVSRAKYWIKEYNNFPMRPLKWLSPKEKYLEYIKG